jgi:hypothetical protein
MSGLAWTMNCAVAIALAALVIAKWSVYKMAQHVNSMVGPGDRISLKWWPNYKDRRVMKTYHRVFPDGRLNVVYISCIGSALIVVLLAVVLASRLQP